MLSDYMPGVFDEAGFAGWIGAGCGGDWSL
jgi:hypothetical protein